MISPPLPNRLYTIAINSVITFRYFGENLKEASIRLESEQNRTKDYAAPAWFYNVRLR